ncbi:hypothetical protein GW17_00014574 [Ensete ventricosum]|nr:hypothetical protein GW17_00014574 [Ensete ventricosum]
MRETMDAYMLEDFVAARRKEKTAAKAKGAKQSEDSTARASKEEEKRKTLLAREAIKEKKAVDDGGSVEEDAMIVRLVSWNLVALFFLFLTCFLELTIPWVLIVSESSGGKETFAIGFPVFSRGTQFTAMVDAMGTGTSVIAHRPLCQTPPPFKDVSFKRRRLPVPGRFLDSTVKLLAKEKNPSREDWQRISDDVGYTTDSTGLSPGRTWPPVNKADDPTIHNPLLRRERMGCGWLAVIFEWEGVIVEDDDPELEHRAWVALSQEEGKSPPLAFVLRRMEGMKSEQAISEVLCWSRNPTELERLASRKEDIYQSFKNGGHCHLRSGSREFMTTLANHKIPLAVASTRRRKALQGEIEAVGAQSFFDVVVAAEEVHRGKPDPEMLIHAARLLGFIPERCIVFGNSISTVEAARDAGMKCVAVASKQPVYELRAADLVVRRLDELSVVDLKKLADVDSPQLEPGEDRGGSQR